MTENSANMCSITLLRHGHALSGDGVMEDAARPLSERGREEAIYIAHAMKQREWSPTLVLCSAAVRTRETMEILQQEGALIGAELCLEESLYLASAGHLLAELEEHMKRGEHFMFIGHNPGLHQLAAMLAEVGDEALLQSLAMRFPPCSLVHFSLAGAPGQGGRLVDFITPQ